MVGAVDREVQGDSLDWPKDPHSVFGQHIGALHHVGDPTIVEVSVARHASEEPRLLAIPSGFFSRKVHGFLIRPFRLDAAALRRQHSRWDAEGPSEYFAAFD